MANRGSELQESTIMTHWNHSLSTTPFRLCTGLLLLVSVTFVLYFAGNVSIFDRGLPRTPIASILVPNEMEIGEVVKCNALASRDPNNEPLLFQWDLNGDGVWEKTTNTGILEVHFWDDLAPLGYWHNDMVVVAVRVTNSSGRSSIAKGRILIINAKRKQQERTGHQPRH